MCKNDNEEGKRTQACRKVSIMGAISKVELIKMRRNNLWEPQGY